MIKHILACSLMIGATSSVLAESATAPANVDLFKNAELSLNVGTTGLGLNLTYSFDPSFKVRAGYSFANGSHTVNSEEMRQDGTFELNNAVLLADYYPWAQGFRVTGGLNVINLHFKGHAEKTAAGFIYINDVPYSSSEVGSADLDVQWHGTKPYIGIGYDGFNASQTAGFFFTTDVGVIFSGSPSVKLDTTCAASNPIICTNIDQDSKAEQEQLKDDLDSIKVLPVIQVGLGYRF